MATVHRRSRAKRSRLTDPPAGPERADSGIRGCPAEGAPCHVEPDGPAPKPWARPVLTYVVSRNCGGHRVATEAHVGNIKSPEWSYYASALTMSC